MLHVFGHTNPDTDAIAAAMVYASFLNKTGTPAQAYCLGELNFETPYVLREAGVDAPPLLPKLEAGTEVALVDHNEASQSVGNLSELTVSHVIDHHRLGDLQTASPLTVRLAPVGCTCTILFGMFREANVPIETQDARLMLSAILSDTLHFRSPTTVGADREAVEVLAPIAGVDDVTAYAMAMFAAKSDLGDTPAEQLVQMDYKEYVFGASEDAEGQRWGMGVTETTNPAYALGRKAELLAAMRDIKARDGLDGLLLSVVDILEGRNTALIASDTEAALVRDVFGVETQEGRADLGGRISRKKQLIPEIEAYFERQ